MKTIIIALCVLFSSIYASAQTEEKAIQKALSDETTAFFNHDFKTAFSYWHVIPQSSFIISLADGKNNF